MIRPSSLLLALCALSAVLAPVLVGEPAKAATYGCFKVNVPALNIRARPYSDAEIIGTASKGEILEKRKLLCTPRGYWCAIRKGTLEGYADKTMMVKMPCP